MTPEQYTENAVKRLSGTNTLVGLALGLGGETGEVLEALKKRDFHGKPIEDQKFLDELGDVLWYLTMMLHRLDYTLEDCMIYNDQKLGKRYPRGFSTEASIERADENG